MELTFYFVLFRSRVAFVSDFGAHGETEGLESGVCVFDIVSLDQNLNCRGELEFIFSYQVDFCIWEDLMKDCEIFFCRLLDELVVFHQQPR